MERQAPPPLSRNVRALGWVSFLNDWSSDMITPLLPAFLAVTLGAGPAAIGLIEGVAETTMSLLKLVSGTWSDHLKRRKPMVVGGYALSNLLRPLIAIAGAWWHVLIFRFGDRIGKGLRTTPRDALIVESVEEAHRGRAFGLQRAMDHAGAMAGAGSGALAIWLLDGNYRIVFLLSILPGLAGVWVAAKHTHEPPRQPKEKKPGLGEILDGLRQMPPGFRRFLLAVMVFMLGSSTDLFLLLRAHEVGMPDWSIPLLWVGLHSIKTVSVPIGGWLSDHIGPRQPMVWGWILYAIIYAAMGWVETPGLIVAILLSYGFFYGLTEAPERVLAAEYAPPHLRGTAFGILYLVEGLAALPASALFGLVWSAFGAPAAFGLSSLLAIIGAAILQTTRTGREIPKTA